MDADTEPSEARPGDRPILKPADLFPALVRGVLAVPTFFIHEADELSLLYYCDRNLCLVHLCAYTEK